VRRGKWLAQPRFVWPRLYAMVRFLEKREENRRRLQLFACACCRRVWSLLQMDSARRIVELAEACADGEVPQAELEAAHGHPDFTRLEAQLRGEGDTGIQLTFRIVNALRAAQHLASPQMDVCYILQAASGTPARDFEVGPRWHLSGEGMGRSCDEVELAAMLDILRDIFGNPFRPAPFDPTWRTETVGLLARHMYYSRDFSGMPILGDALEEAGCANAEILDHCRGDCVHVRGCWVLDSALGKTKPLPHRRRSRRVQ
jgi:hypothetical protein